MIRLVSAVAAVALLSGANGCCACTNSSSYERRGATGTGSPAVPLSAPIVRALHFGDFGEANCQQAAVAAGIADAQRRKPFDLAIHAGDNLYDCGANWRSDAAARCAFSDDGKTVAPGYVPPHDPGFQEKFEDALGALSGAGVPVYLALGNHDVATWGTCAPIGDPVAVSRAKACLEVAHRSPVWTMPARHYVVNKGPARFIVLDGNLVGADYGGFTLADEVTFLAAESAGCDALACFVVVHQPPATAGNHVSDFSPSFTTRMDQLVAAGGGRIRAWLAAHDHDLQHVRTAGGLDVFISGNGSRDRTGERFDRTAPAGATLLYGTVRWGYAIVEVAANGFTWRVEDHRGSPRYCCVATLSETWSTCEPVPCD